MELVKITIKENMYGSQTATKICLYVRKKDEYESINLPLANIIVN